MTRRARFEVNHAALDELTMSAADGMADLARAILRVAESRAPDAPPFGEGLVMRGAAIVWVGKKRTHQVRTDGSSATVPKPRQSPRLQEGFITAMVGFGFPASFVEFDTSRTHAQPFLTPSLGEVAGQDALLILSKPMQRRLRGERNTEVADRVAAARAKKAAATAARQATP